MSKAEEIIEHNLTAGAIVTIEAGSAALVLDLAGGTGLVPWFAAGTHTYQPCDESGVVLPGSASADLVSGTKVDMLSRFYKITVDGANDLSIAKV